MRWMRLLQQRWNDLLAEWNQKIPPLLTAGG
jgi:hypothetical protein